MTGRWPWMRPERAGHVTAFLAAHPPWQEGRYDTLRARLRYLHARVRVDARVPGADIRDVFHEFGAGGDEDPESLATTWFGLISPFLLWQTELEFDLLPFALRPLVALGASTPGDVLAFVEGKVVPELAQQVGRSFFDADGWLFLDEIFPERSASIRHALAHL